MKKEEKPESNRNRVMLIKVIIPPSGVHTALSGLKGEANL